MGYQSYGAHVSKPWAPGLQSNYAGLPRTHEQNTVNDLHQRSRVGRLKAGHAQNVSLHTPVYT